MNSDQKAKGKSIPLGIKLLFSRFVWSASLLALIVWLFQGNSENPDKEIWALILSFIWLIYALFSPWRTTYVDAWTKKKKTKTSFLIFKVINFGVGGAIIGNCIFSGIAEEMSLTSIAEPTVAPRILIREKAKECALKEASGEVNPIFYVPKLNQYLITPSDGNCDGDENNLITAISKETSKYPTYSYNMKTKEKTCSHDGPNEELHGCSAKSGGKW